MESSTTTTTHDALLNELEAPLLRYAVSLGLSTHDAQDAVQDGLIALARKMDKSSESIRNPKAYAFTIVRNNANRRFLDRTRRNEVEIQEDHPAHRDESDKFNDPVLTEAFQQAYATLSMAERDLIRKYYVDRRTFDEIGKELGCSAQNVWKTLRKIVSQVLAGEVRKCLTQADPDFAKELFNR